jgi:hypothetical protein
MVVFSEVNIFWHRARWKRDARDHVPFIPELEYPA